MSNHDQKYLYKYRSLAGEAKERLRGTLFNNELYFAKPEEFNDPFDCAPVIRTDASEEEKFEYFVRVVKRNDPNMTRSARRILARRLSKNPSLFHKTMQQAYTDLINEVGVFSLSTKNDHILMWSHYADSHKGVCLRFRVSVTEPYFARALPVQYTETRPVFDRVRHSTGELVDKALLTKADYWSYEAEYRLIDHENGSGLQNFPPMLLDGIILGARISQQDKVDVCAWAAARKIETEILCSEFDSENFRLNIVS